MEKWKSGKFRNSEEDINENYDIEIEAIVKKYNTKSKFIDKVRNLSKVQIGLIAFCGLLLLGLILPEPDVNEAFDTIKRMSKIEMNKEEISEYESSCRIVITKKDTNLTSDLLDILNEKDTKDEAILTTLKEFSSSYRESIDYSKLINLLGHENEEVAKKAAYVMASNDKVENENIFLEYAESLKNDQDKLMRAYSVYSKRSVGNKDNIYKLEVDPKSTINSYVYNNLDNKEFKKFISYNKNIDKINDGLVIVGKELIENRDYSKFEVYNKALNSIRDLGIEIDSTKLKDIEDTINEGIVK